MQNLLDELKQKKEQLDKLRPLSKAQIKNLKNVYDIQLTYNSNAIEGSTLTYSETKLILNEGITIGGKSMNEHLEAINHQEAIGFIEDVAKTKTKDITLADIRNIHYLILKGIDNKNAGKYRTQNVAVVKSNGSLHNFAEPLKIDEKMNKFVNWLHTQTVEEPILLASLVHLKFVSIHPFIDGNERTARLLMNLVLLQNTYPQAIIKVSNRAEYIQAIEKYQQSSDSDYNDFYKVLLKSVNDSLDLYSTILTNDIKVI
ncbi:MAG: Fic family protein [Campylobacterota bacterium]|nr:Fic family protein [Campylobacterota bacterium]